MFRFSTLLSTVIFSVIFFLPITKVIAQGSCATAVTVSNLTGSPCATATPNATSTITPPAGCVNGTFDTWFTFVAQGNSATITVSNTTANWNPEFIVVTSSNNTCTGTLTVVQCFDLAGNFTSINGTINALNNGQRYWIVVSSGNANNTTGTISTCVNNPVVANNCLNNDACLDATPITLNAIGGGAACISDCNIGSNPGIDFVGNICADLPNATVWYVITTGASTASLNINLSSASLSDPEFVIFQGNSCTTWTTVNCTEGTGGTASATATVKLLSFQGQQE